MDTFLKFLIGLLAVIMIGAAAIMMEGAPGSAATMRAKLQENAELALAGEDSQHVSVTMDGQKAILSGAVGDEAARETVLNRIATSTGPGGLFSGGVTAVDASQLKVAPPLPVAAPFIFIAERENGVVSFSGHVPDQVTRDAIYRLAADLFPDAEISGELEIAGGAPAGAADWFNAASSALRSLSHLRNGVAQANDDDFALTGEAEDETRAAAARALLSGLPAGLKGRADIEIRKPPASIEDIISQVEEEPADNAETVAAAVEVKSEIVQEDGCAERLTAAINARRIGFISARADIDNPSRDQLRRIAGIFTECQSVRLAITGHTDSSGNAARNRQLSGYRADAVRAFLISVGAPADRISARGAGSSEPVVSNSTPAGRERNRRIEIDVITE